MQESPYQDASHASRAQKIRLLVSFLYFLLACGVLMVTFPIRLYLFGFRTPHLITFASYLLVAAIISAVSIWGGPLLIKKLGGNVEAWIPLILAGVLSLACLCFMAILFGPFGADIPGLSVRGIFFAEWEFMKFIFNDAVPMTVVAVILNRIVARGGVRL